MKIRPPNLFRRSLFCVLLLFLGFALSTLSAPKVEATNYVVNWIFQDEPDSNLADGVCQTASGVIAGVNHCSLRAAIEQLGGPGGPTAFCGASNNITFDYAALNAGLNATNVSTLPSYGQSGKVSCALSSLSPSACYKNPGGEVGSSLTQNIDLTMFIGE